MFKILTRLFGSRNDRILKTIDPMVEKINSFEPSIQLLSAEALAAKTVELRRRFNDEGATLDDLLPEAFAIVREAAHRVLGMRHFDVQLVGGVVLHQGCIAEMRTGEGKTLTATLAVYLNALNGRGVHVVTVNDYLASRDGAQMGELYAFLGLTTGVLVHGITQEERRAAYACDIVYGTNNEFGFDYLRDNMVFTRDDLVQRDYAFAIVDEVDSILVDEARTPLIISGQSEEATVLYQQANELLKHLTPEDYEKDEKDKAVAFTETGSDHMDALCIEADLIAEGTDLYDPENINVLHAVTQSLRAHTLFTRDVDYMVRGGEVLIIDEFTGRMMEGRRYSDGQHQALEAKEGVTVQPENQTLASITFQNYFRMYDKLAGMTGTADTEAEEFQKIYDLEVVIIPTNRSMVREDKDDLVYRDLQDKHNAIVEHVIASHKTGAPVLVGTISIEKSELLSNMLTQRDVKHSVLNAKHHEDEAMIVAQAGRKGAVTIATNMAGRGTDIMLGGNPDMMIGQLPEKLNDAQRETQAAEIRRQCATEHEEVVAAGGLYIAGTERHDSRRIDNQLRGRSGRQGDPGITRFYLSPEDDLMRIFGGEKMQAMMKRFGFKEGEVIENPLINKAVENSQKKVEGRNFDIRKQLLEYDDVMNKQREVIYSQRRELLEADDVHDVIVNMTEDVAKEVVLKHLQGRPDEWDAEALQAEVKEILDMDVDAQAWIDSDDVDTADDVSAMLVQAINEALVNKEEQFGTEQLRPFEKWLLLNVLDHHWKEHLLAMDHLRQSVGLRGYAQKQPIQEYKRESFELFSGLIDRVRAQTINSLFHVQAQEAEQAAEQPPEEPQDVHYRHGDKEVEEGSASNEPIHRTERKVGRNEPCPCGSGKKYKQCHGRRK
ncbi:MAG: preprotein translocase subunit SecA [Mariprofundaceae bacterium]|nr:preprotein translocase subunit SecA [Mariprofundaceae bacterium]